MLQRDVEYVGFPIDVHGGWAGARWHECAVGAVDGDRYEAGRVGGGEISADGITGPVAFQADGIVIVELIADGKRRRRHNIMGLRAPQRGGQVSAERRWAAKAREAITDFLIAAYDAGLGAQADKDPVIVKIFLSSRGAYRHDSEKSPYQHTEASHGFKPGNIWHL